MQEPTTSGCQRCGSELEKHTGRGRPRKWCSRECQLAAYREERPGRHRAISGPHFCERCGGQYEGRKRKYCGECKPESKPPLACDCCGGRATPRSRYPTCDSCQKRPCEICGTPFKRATNKGIIQRTCSRQCGVELRRRIGNLAPTGRSTAVPWRECLGCATTFIARRGLRYCARCRSTADYGYWLKRRKRDLKEYEPRPCRVCGTAFTPERPQRQGNASQAAYCSKKCRAEGDRRSHRAHNHKRRHRKRTNGTYEAFTLLEIAERDGWRCHLCGRKVTRKNWSVDHLVPIVYGGDHTRANVSLAHHLCNSRRGAGRMPAQLRLTG